MQHVFIIGCKGIPSQYGGYETFVENLTFYQNNETTQYHVACGVDNARLYPKEFTHNGARCFNLQWKKLGSARAIFYDIEAIKESIAYIKQHNIEHPIIYILACRIGPFVNRYIKQIHALGGKVYVNPDGHEWLRAKWSRPIRAYWKLSERLMVKYSDLLICDSTHIEAYIHSAYQEYAPQTTYIAYGAETRKSALVDDDTTLLNWYQEKGLTPQNYYLVVGRFVPENNYETMIREFMRSNSTKDFALITNVSAKFQHELYKKTGCDKDPRIKFVGTVYEQELLMKIRENAFAYFHGHEVGGTNPSLLEALSSTRLNLLLNVGFNEEVAADAALYWTKDTGNLAALIEKVETFTDAEITCFAEKSLCRVKDCYSWEFIAEQYHSIFHDSKRNIGCP